MITATINPMKEKYIATFLVHANRPDLAPLEFFANAVKNTQKEAEMWAINQYKLWLKTQVKKFLTQREIAFIKVGALSYEYSNVIKQCRKIKDQPSLTTVCMFIVDNQELLRALVPGKQSTQHYWAYTIEEIITGAHDYIVLNQKLVKNYGVVH
jgi:hypothetical protein